MRDDPTVGQLVYLNSGSPLMTVVEIDDDEVKVGWIDNNFHPHFATYPTPCLKEIEDAAV